jgi:hypothetical protein
LRTSITLKRQDREKKGTCDVEVLEVDGWFFRMRPDADWRLVRQRRLPNRRPYDLIWSFSTTDFASHCP